MNHNTSQLYMAKLSNAAGMLELLSHKGFQEDRNLKGFIKDKWDFEAFSTRIKSSKVDPQLTETNCKLSDAAIAGHNEIGHYRRENAVGTQETYVFNTPVPSQNAFFSGSYALTQKAFPEDKKLDGENLMNKQGATVDPNLKAYIAKFRY